MDVERLRERIVEAINSYDVLEAIQDTLGHVAEMHDELGEGATLFSDASPESGQVDDFIDTFQTVLGEVYYGTTLHEREAAVGGFLLGFAVARQLAETSLKDTEPTSFDAE